MMTSSSHTKRRLLDDTNPKSALSISTLTERSDPRYNGLRHFRWLSSSAIACVLTIVADESVKTQDRRECPQNPAPDTVMSRGVVLAPEPGEMLLGRKRATYKNVSGETTKSNPFEVRETVAFLAIDGGALQSTTLDDCQIAGLRLVVLWRSPNLQRISKDSGKLEPTSVTRVPPVS
eukprot:123676-Rhodomonas_salina.1